MITETDTVWLFRSPTSTPLHKRSAPTPVAAAQCLDCHYFNDIAQFPSFATFIRCLSIDPHKSNGLCCRHHYAAT